MSEKYLIKYSQVLPPVGGLCPECQKDTIRQSRFKSGGVYCRTCKIIWKLQPKQPSKLFNLATKEDIEEIKKEIGFLKEQMEFYKDLTKQLLDALKKFEGNVYLLTKLPSEEEKKEEIPVVEEEKSKKEEKGEDEINSDEIPF
jgi:predicted amidophosphoribosyltransferase